jgi:hypothetical protein
VATETFELKRFVWATPDRLEIEGRFAGLRVEAIDRPVLVLRGDEQTHRLPAINDEAPSADGGDWRAAFAWLEAPTAFGTAELELGEDLVVELPEPLLNGDDSERGVLEVRRRGGQRLRLQAEALAVRSQLGEAQAERDRKAKELARAREDLDEERAARARDAESFRASLAQAQEAAEEAVAEARDEVAALRARIAQLTNASTEAERLRSRLVSIREIIDQGTNDSGGSGGDAASP